MVHLFLMVSADYCVPRFREVRYLAPACAGAPVYAVLVLEEKESQCHSEGFRLHLVVRGTLDVRRLHLASHEFPIVPTGDR